LRGGQVNGIYQCAVKGINGGIGEDSGRKKAESLNKDSATVGREKFDNPLKL
jgi:hypothetical protein